MGVDACIYIRTKDGEVPELEWECEEVFIDPVREDDPLKPGGATHEVDAHYRYYEAGYERGPWPEIAKILMSIFACPQVERVWYFGDHEEPRKIYPSKVIQLTENYMGVR